jgi:hypothetical protein
MYAQMRVRLFRTSLYVEPNFAIGSNVIVAGTAIFNADDPAAVIAQLKATVESAQAAARGA